MKLRPVPFTELLPATAFAFRGYDRTNLGRTPELLAHPVYGSIVEAALRERSEVSGVAGHKESCLRGLSPDARAE